MTQQVNIGMSRRQMLKGIGVVGLGVTGALDIARIGLSTARAQADPANDTVAGIYRFRVGNFNATAILDGIVPFDPVIYGVNVAPEEVTAFLTENNLPTDVASLSINVLLLQNGDETILIDTGLAGATVGNSISAPNSGKLLATLDMLGVAPETVTQVILSHMNFDHTSGASEGETPVFPNARYYFPQIELEFMSSAPANETAQYLISLGNAEIQPLIAADRLTLYAADDEVVPGIQAIAAPGHTPGHMAFLLSSEGSQLLLLEDVAPHPVISLRHPEWHFGFHLDQEQAIETRQRILGRAADEGLQVFSYHFPFPGIGYIARDGEVFRFSALS